MNKLNIQSIVDEIQSHFSCPQKIKEASATAVMNDVESWAQYTREIENKIIALNDEMNKLKGAAPRPKIRKQTKDNPDHSSESDRKSRRNRKPRKKKKSKKGKVHVDRVNKIEMNKDSLPSDAVRAGVKRTIVQDIKFTTDNIAFDRQKYYSKSENKYYITPLPEGYSGGYGPNLKAWASTLYSTAQMTMGNIAWLFNTAGSIISKTTICRIIINDNEVLHAEKDDIAKASVQASDYQHLDDTSGREKGKNRYVNVLTNQYAAIFYTLTSKDRLSIVEMLSLEGLDFVLNEEALLLMGIMGVPQKHIDSFRENKSDDFKSRGSVDELLGKKFPNTQKHQRIRKLVIEAMAIAAYRQSKYAIKNLIVDDAPQFKLITENIGLCWVHEGRHYKKLAPLFLVNKNHLDEFQTQFWDYYKNLKEYKKNPSKNKAEELGHDFDKLFSQETGYDALDKQIKRTRNKKKSLLLALKYPWQFLQKKSTFSKSPIPRRNHTATTMKTEKLSYKGF